MGKDRPVPAGARSAQPLAAVEGEAGTGGCKIKGNVSKAGRIYHVSGSPSYANTKIDESKGERWFCSEEQARAAGWVAPRS